MIRTIIGITYTVISYSVGVAVTQVMLALEPIIKRLLR